jgi:anti-sigma factor (TIGR02949 family)
VSRHDCEQALAHLQDYLKHEITPELAAEVRQHLERCRPCLKHARFEENFLMLLEACGSKHMCPGRLRARIMAMLREEAQGD